MLITLVITLAALGGFFIGAYVGTRYTRPRAYQAGYEAGRLDFARAVVNRVTTKFGGNTPAA